MAARGLGMDEGSATLKAVEVEKQGPTYVPVRAASVESGEDGAGAGAISPALSEAGIKSKTMIAGLTGKDLVIRYHQVPPVADWQLRKIMDFEIDELKRQSGDEMAADFNLLPVSSDLSSDDIVLLALTREDRVNERTQEWKSAGLKVRHFTPNALALYHAFRMYGPAVEGDMLIANIGATVSDLAILRDGDLLYARSVNSAGDVLTDALVEQFGVSRGKAEKLKQEFGDLRPREARKGLTSQQEKVSYALEGAAGRLYSMVQSTVQFAKSQIQLNQLDLTRVFITGGTANIPGLADYFARNLECPVDEFDPMADADVDMVGPAGPKEYVVALGLALMAADPDAYSVEVLAAPMRRAREFQEKHIFTVLGVLLVAVFLGLLYVRSKDEHARATSDKRAVTREQNKRRTNKTRLDQLVEERAQLAEMVDVLEKKRAAGEGFARSLELLAENMPTDLWVRGIELEFEEGKRRARTREARKPVISIDGSGKSRGERSVDDSYADFINAMRSEPQLSRPGQFTDQPPTQRDTFDFRLRLDFLQGAEIASEEDDGEEDEG